MSDFTTKPSVTKGSSTGLTKPPGVANEDVSNNPGEEFNCTNVQEVHVRFSDPGYVNRNEVGLYVNYAGMPPGSKVLRIWWDYENNPGDWQDIDIGEGQVWRSDDTLFDYETIVEHTYDVAIETSFSGSRRNDLSGQDRQLCPGKGRDGHSRCGRTDRCSSAGAFHQPHDQRRLQLRFRRQ